MEDFCIVVNLPNGKEFLAGTDMIWEDVIRMKLGLKPQREN